MFKEKRLLYKNPFHAGLVKFGNTTTSQPIDDGDLTYVDGVGFRFKQEGTISTFQTSSTGGASQALDNLASVEINESLISDTDSTDDLGSSSKFWANTYTDTLLLNTTASFSGALAGTAALTGILTVSGATTLTGNVSAGGDFDVSGALTVGSFAADGITAATTNADLTLDGNGTGGVDISSTGTGDINLGDDTVLATGKDFTMVLGTFTSTDGDVVLDEGKITVDTTADETSYIKRNQAATTGALFELEETNASADNETLLIDSNATGATESVIIDHEGTADCMTLTSLAAGASLIKATAEAATGTVYEAISAASSTVAMGIFTNGGTGATGWLGATGVGQVQIVNDGDLAHANASSLLIEYSGTGAATGLGTSLRIVDTGATATSYAAYISSASGKALNIASGVSLFETDVTIGVGSGTGADLICNGTTASKFIHWDESEDKLYIADDTTLGFGGAPGGSDGVTMLWKDANSALEIDAVNANEDVVIGTNVDTDLIWHGTSGVAMTCSATADTITLAAGVQLIVTGNTTSGDGLVIPNHATNTPNGSVNGSIFFEQDAKKLWIYNDDSSSWVGVVLA